MPEDRQAAAEGRRQANADTLWVQGKEGLPAYAIRPLGSQESGPVPGEMDVLSRLPGWKQQEIGRIADAGARRQHLAAWQLLEELLVQERLCRDIADLDIRRGAHGKPYCAGAGPFFSISHCKEAVACVAGEQPCGIDVERRFLYRETLMRRICSAGEQMLGGTAGWQEAGREELLHVLWSAKEAALKMDGRGLSYGMERLDLSELLAAAPPKSLGAAWTCGKVAGIGPVKLRVFVTEMYTAAICIEG